MIPSFVRAALVSGLFVGTIVYASHNCDPFTVGVVSTLPIGILSFVFIKDSILPSYRDGYLLGFLIAIIAISCFLLLVKNKKPIEAYVTSVLLWAIVVGGLFFIRKSEK